MSRFTSVRLPLAGLRRIERQRMGDGRGFLSRIYCAQELALSGWDKPIAQINHTVTCKKGTVRGLHFQHQPYSEMKLVSVLRGEIWDVAVDLRKESSTFLQWHAEVLSAENGRAMFIPEGFAHGFQSLTDDVELLYCHSVAYNPLAESGLHPLDASLAINWPLTLFEISERDQNHALIDSDFSGITA